MGVTAPPRPSDRRRRPEPLGAPGGQRPPGRFTDDLFRWVALASGLLVLVILALILYSTTDKAWPWFQSEGLGVFERQLGPGEGPVRCRGDDLRHVPRRRHRAGDRGAGQRRHRVVRDRGVAPRRSAKPIMYTVDLLAAIPSVVYGLWAYRRVAPARSPTSTSNISSATERHPDLEDPVRRTRARRD